MKVTLGPWEDVEIITDEAHAILSVRFEEGEVRVFADLPDGLGRQGWVYETHDRDPEKPFVIHDALVQVDSYLERVAVALYRAAGDKDLSLEIESLAGARHRLSGLSTCSVGQLPLNKISPKPREACPEFPEELDPFANVTLKLTNSGKDLEDLMKLVKEQGHLLQGHLAYEEASRATFEAFSPRTKTNVQQYKDSCKQLADMLSTKTIDPDVRAVIGLNQKAMNDLFLTFHEYLGTLVAASDARHAIISKVVSSMADDRGNVAPEDGEN